MRGKAARETETICLINVEAQLRADHPLREVKRMCKEVLKALEPELARMVAAKGRPSIPPERLLTLCGTVCGECLQSDEDGETGVGGGEPAATPSGGVSSIGPAMPRHLENEANRA